MRRFRFAALSIFVVQNALAQSGEAPKPESPPAAPTPPAPEDEGDIEDVPVGDEPSDKAPEPKPDDPKRSPAPSPATPPKKDEQTPSEEGEGDEDISEAELEAELDGADMKKPPPKGQGSIVGVITDTKFNEPLVEAQIEVVGQKKRIFTDLEGRYRLDLPPGTYSIRAAYELHKSSRADGVRVVAGKIERLNLELVPDESAVDEIVVETEFAQESAEGGTLERKRSATVGDGVGRAEIARTPDRNAAEAAQRVVGATIVGGRFVYVRGLGERYTNALLNGAPLPSPEPDRQTVPLDLFPSLVLDSVNIVKQFTPDYPGDFAGGSVRINTREFPRETLFQVSLNAGYNTEATFRKRLDYRGSSTDWLGFDDGIRQLPDGIPAEKLDADDTVPWGRRVNSYLSTLRSGTPPNHGVSVVAGDSWKFGKDLKLGAIGALSYGRSYQLRKLTINNYTTHRQPDDSVVLRGADQFRGEQGIDTVRWGAFVSSTLEITPKHQFRFTGLRSQSADDLTSDLEGEFFNNPGTIVRSTHLEYVTRALNFAQLGGHHELPGLNQPVVDWFGSLAVASREQPDTRDLRYQKLPATSPEAPGYQWQEGPTSPLHFYSEQSEVTWNGGLDLTQLIIKGEETETKLKLGGLITTRSREFDARRFSLERPQERVQPPLDGRNICRGASWNRACPDILFTEDLIDGTRLLLRETTALFDEYEASLDVYAAYAMVDTQVLKNVRVVGGARVEVTDQRFTAYDPFDHASDLTKRSAIESTDVLPALSVVYAPTQKSNTRFGLSQTIARPQLREITPFVSSSYTAELPTQGNPDLKLTRIVNADLRYEYFPTLREVAAFSFFYKHFKDPIEEIILVGPQSGVLSYANAKSADLIGIELETRKTLEFATPVLKDFTAIANLTLAKSTVDLGQATGAATDPYRPLSLQSPYVVNLAIDYGNSKTGTDVRILYNVLGPRITTVGVLGIPDVYEIPRHVVDATAAQKIADHFELKLVAQNLLGAPIVFTHRGAREYVAVDDSGILRPGGRDPVRRRYQPGTTFTLSATYTY